jgi:hypothetical protein
MRTLKKSLLVLAGLLSPALVGARADAGVIPWVYDSVFGYGWGYGYGGMPYGGYGGYGYGGGYPVSYAAPAYTTNYAPSYGYADYSLGGEYLADSSCCDPCSNGCSTGGCATSDCCTTAVQSAKPAAPEPTPINQKVTPANPKKDLPVDEFQGLGPTRPGGTDKVNSGSTEEVLPGDENRPARPLPGGQVEPDRPDQGMQTPAPDEGSGVREMMTPRQNNIAVRYLPSTTRTRIAVPSSVNRVVRVDRATREQLVQGQSKPQLAANP